MAGLFWSDDVDAVNERAIALWPMLASSVPCGGLAGMGCKENVDGSRTKRGMPYQGFACLGYGQASVMIVVSQVVACTARRFGAHLVKRALASRGLSKAGSREEQAQRLADYILYPFEKGELQTLWRCTRPEGVDIRLMIGFDAPRHAAQGPRMHEVVMASEERVGSDGVRCLRLADGRGWLPTADPHGQALFTRENAKHVHLKVEEPWQWSQAGLLSLIDRNGVRPWLVVEAYVDGANGERRALHPFPKSPPWEVRVDDMLFPLTVTLIMPPPSQPAEPASQSPPEAAATPLKKRPPHDEAASELKQSRAAAPGEAVARQQRRRLRQKTPATAFKPPAALR